jgi:hypothetical protein
MLEHVEPSLINLAKYRLLDNMITPSLIDKIGKELKIKFKIYNGDDANKHN